MESSGQVPDHPATSYDSSVAPSWGSWRYRFTRRNCFSAESMAAAAQGLLGVAKRWHCQACGSRWAGLVVVAGSKSTSFQNGISGRRADLGTQRTPFRAPAAGVVGQSGARELGSSSRGPRWQGTRIPLQATDNISYQKLVAEAAHPGGRESAPPLSLPAASEGRVALRDGNPRLQAGEEVNREASWALYPATNEVQGQRRADCRCQLSDSSYPVRSG